MTDGTARDPAFPPNAASGAPTLPPGHGPPPYGPEQYGPPPYGPQQYGPPQYGPPQYGPPQYAPLEYGPQQYGLPPGYQPPWAAPRPGCIPLRPLGVSDILDGSFRVMRRNPRATLGLSAVVAVVQAGVLAVFEWVANSQIGESAPESNDGAQSFDSGSAIGVLSGAFSLLVLAAVFGAILTGMLTLVITDDVLGHRTPLGALWTRVRPRLPRLIGLSFLIGLLQLLGLCLFVAPGIWLWGIWAVAVPAFMVEDLGAVAAMRRSRDLVRGTFWRVWGIRVLGVIVVGVISAILGVPFKVIGAVFGGSESGVGLPIAYVLLTSVGSILSMTFTAPLRAGIDALLYIDLRMRKEGLDIVLQERAARGATAR